MTASKSKTAATRALREAENAELIRLHGQGLASRDIADALGIGTMTVYRRFKRLGLLAPRKRRISSAKVLELATRYWSGEPAGKLAEEYGLHNAVAVRRAAARVRHKRSKLKGLETLLRNRAAGVTPQEAKVASYNPPPDPTTAMTTRNGQRTAPLRVKFPPLPGEPGYVYGQP